MECALQGYSWRIKMHHELIIETNIVRDPHVKQNQMQWVLLTHTEGGFKLGEEAEVSTFISPRRVRWELRKIIDVEGGVKWKCMYHCLYCIRKVKKLKAQKGENLAMKTKQGRNPFYPTFCCWFLTVEHYSRGLPVYQNQEVTGAKKATWIVMNLRLNVKSNLLGLKLSKLDLFAMCKDLFKSYNWELNISGIGGAKSFDHDNVDKTRTGWCLL